MHKEQAGVKQKPKPGVKRFRTGMQDTNGLRGLSVSGGPPVAPSELSCTDSLSSSARHSACKRVTHHNNVVSYSTCTTTGSLPNDILN